MAEPARAIQGTWLAAQPIWLQWIELPNTDGRKPRKFPLYPGRNASPRGKRRSKWDVPTGEYDSPENNIELDSVEDRGRLTTFANLELQHNARPGYALGPLPSGHVLCGIDLDDCYELDGTLKSDTRPIYDAAVAAGALVERSINRTGLHIVWASVPSTLPEVRKDIVEVYTGSRYFAWGSEILSPGVEGTPDMSRVLALLPPAPERQRPAEDAQTFDPIHRNNFLFDRMVAFSREGLSGEALKDAVLSINDRLVNPLDEQEIQDTIFKRIGKIVAPSKVKLGLGVVVDLSKLQGQYIKLHDPSQVMQSLHEVRYIIDGFIEAGALGMLWGPPGSFKSFIALDWGLCVATGTKWFGLPVRQGPVIYIAGEGRRGIARRMKAWCKANSVDPASIANFYATGGAVNARDASFATEIIEMSGAMGKPALIVIDTLARNFGGGDENSAQDVGQLIDVVDRQLAQHLGATVLLVHHSKKEGGDYRGSSALKGAVDFEYEVTRKGAALECTLTCKKMKDSEQQKPVTFKLGKSGSFDPVIGDDEATAEMMS